MKNAYPVAHVGLGFVALCTVTMLGVIWRVGVRVERELAAFGAALSAPTQLAMDSRVALSIFVAVLFLVAVLVHRLRHGVLFLVLLGLLELSLGAAYGLALWLPYRPPGAAIK